SFNVAKRTVLASASNLFPSTVTVLRNGLDMWVVLSLPSLWVSVELQAAGAAASGERPGCGHSTCPAPSAFSGCTLSACRLLLCSLRSKLGGIDLKAEAFTWSR